MGVANLAADGTPMNEGSVGLANSDLFSYEGADINMFRETYAESRP